MSVDQEIEWGWTQHDMQTELDELLEEAEVGLTGAEDRNGRIAFLTAELEALRDVRQ